MAGGGDNCPQCGSPLAKDQRYCLVCGARRGDPRLPFMDAVVFMDAVKQPQPGTEGDGGKPAATPTKRPLLSANASLVAGVATLVLAIGVGVLIGRTGDSGGGNENPSVIEVHTNGGGGGEVEEAAPEANEGGKEKKTDGSGGKGATGKKESPKEEKEQNEKAESKLDEVFESEANLAKPDQKIGGKCDPSEAGCSSNGKFEGNFFGE
jgi:hypothetical protein